MASKRKSTASQRPRKVLGELERLVGCQMSSLGDIEQLAGELCLVKTKYC